MRIKSLFSGILSCYPGGNEWLFRRYKDRQADAGTSNARYCYSVWLRHLVMGYQHGIAEAPHIVAEIGPGNSLGTGLAALISGVNRYYAFDIVNHTSSDENIKIFEDLITLFRNRENIPDSKEFPLIKTELDSYIFPSDILDDKVLEYALQSKRLDSIRADLLNIDSKNKKKSNYNYISYVVPWNDNKIILEQSVDMIFSMSVLEHIDNLHITYHSAYKWLRHGGFMTHEIDFKCHGHSDIWNGHWAYSDLIWCIIRGNRPYLINREPHSTHLNILNQNNFKIIADIKKQDFSGIKRSKLASKFKNISDEDMSTYNAFILSIKS